MKGRLGFVAVVVVACLAATARADTFTWQAGAAGNASVQANWLQNGGAAARLPASGDAIVLDGTSTQDLTWDAGVNGLTDTVASWLQTAAYSGTVEFPTLYGASGFTNFTISGHCVISNGVWTHTTNPGGDTATYRLAVTVGSAFTLESIASLDVDSDGFQAGSGTGKGSGDNQGPSHGGQGGYKTASAPAPTYGSAFRPTTLGSGGNSGGGGGPGGGAVWLDVGGAAQIDGNILARGGYRPVQAYYRPGAGGSIYVNAASVGGAGTLDARGSAGSVANAWPGGGGGRIAVVLDADTSFGSLSLRASGQPSSVVGSYGAAGTIYLQDMNQGVGEGTLIVDNNDYSLAMYAVTQPSEAMNLNSLAALIVTNGGLFAVVSDTTVDFATATIRGGGELKIRATDNVTFPASFSITEAYRLCLDTPVSAAGNWTVASGGVLTHTLNFYGGSNPARSFDLALDGDLVVQSGGSIDVTERGFPENGGPGVGTGDTRGASHGGHGGSTVAFNDVTPTYGAILQPATHGSGGLTGGGRRAGGGTVSLDVSGAVSIDGDILAKGGDRSASGGSVHIRCGTMSGGGTVDASGGDASNWCGGGGGRVAVILTNDTTMGSVTPKAYGGNGGGTVKEGSAGTVYLETQSAGAGSVIIANNNLTPSTFTPLPAFAASAEDLELTSWIAREKGKIGLVANIRIDTLTLESESYLDLAGYTGTVFSLTVTNQVFDGAMYTAAELGPLVTDSSAGSTGRIVIDIPRGTVIFVK